MWLVSKEGAGEESLDEDDESDVEDIELEFGVSSLSISTSVSSFEVFTFLEALFTFLLVELLVEWTKWIMCDLISEFYRKKQKYIIELLIVEFKSD